MTKAVLEVPASQKADRLAVPLDLAVYVYNEKNYVLGRLGLVMLRGNEGAALGELSTKVGKEGSMNRDKIDAFIRQRNPHISDERIEDLLERKAFDELAGRLKRNVMRRDEMLDFIRERSPGVPEARTSGVLERLIECGGLIEKVSHDGRLKSIPLDELYPPTVYFYDSSKYGKSLTGLMETEKKAFEELKEELAKNNGVMSYMQIVEFMKAKLPDATAGRVSGLIEAVAGGGGLLKVGVTVREEELAAYYKGLICNDEPENFNVRTSLRVFHGVDPRFWHTLDKYNFNLVEPLLQSTQKTNEMLLGEVKGLKEIGFSEELAVRCVKAGMFSDDVKELHLGSSLATAILDAHSNWRKHVNGIKEAAKEFNFDLKSHPHVFDAVSSTTFRNHMEKCLTNGVDPEKDRIITALSSSDKEFDVALERALRRKAKKEEGSL